MELGKKGSGDLTVQPNRMLTTLDRQERLLKAGLASQADYDGAKAQYDGARAQVQQTTASLSQATTNLKYTKIVSPIDGTVVDRQYDVGQTVAASFQAPTLFLIAQDLTKMQVQADVDQSDIGRCRATRLLPTSARASMSRWSRTSSITSTRPPMSRSSSASTPLSSPADASSSSNSFLMTIG